MPKREIVDDVRGMIFVGVAHFGVTHHQPPLTMLTSIVYPCIGERYVPFFYETVP